MDSSNILLVGMAAGLAVMTAIKSHSLLKSEKSDSTEKENEKYGKCKFISFISRNYNFTFRPDNNFGKSVSIFDFCKAQTAQNHQFYRKMHSTAYYGVSFSLQPERHKFPRRPCKLFTGNYKPGRDSRSAFVERQQPAKHFRRHNFIHGPNPRDVGSVAFTPP